MTAESQVAKDAQLIEAVNAGDLTGATTLLATGARPSARDATGRPALMLACKDGADQMMALLLSHGADAAARDFDGRTALMAAADDRAVQVCRSLLKAGADPNVRNVFGQSALMFACYRVEPEIVGLLLDAGADASFVDANGRTALSLITRVHEEAAKACLDLLRTADQSQSRGSDPSFKTLQAYLVESAGPRQWVPIVVMAAAALLVSYLLWAGPGPDTYVAPMASMIMTPIAILVLYWPSIYAFNLGVRQRSAERTVDFEKLRPSPPGSDGQVLNFVQSILRFGLAQVQAISIERTRSIPIPWPLFVSIVLALATTALSLPNEFPWFAPLLMAAFVVEPILRQHALDLIQRKLDQAAALVNEDLEGAMTQAVRDDEPFALYLRAFESTGKIIIHGIDFETALAYYLAPFIQVVTIGSPGEHLGAGRIETTDDAWRHKVADLMERAALIVVVPSDRPGTLWEVLELRKRALLNKTVFAMPPEIPFDATSYSRVWASARRALLAKGMELPNHHVRGLLFKLDATGALAAHAALDQELRFAALGKIFPSMQGGHNGADGGGSDPVGDGMDAGAGGDDSGLAPSCDGNGCWVGIGGGHASAGDGDHHGGAGDGE